MGELLPRRKSCTLGSLQDKEEFSKWSTEQVCVEEDGARKGEHSPQLREHTPGDLLPPGGLLPPGKIPVSPPKEPDVGSEDCEY